MSDIIAIVKDAHAKAFTVTLNTGTIYTLDYTNADRPLYHNDVTNYFVHRFPLKRCTVPADASDELRVACALLNAIDSDRYNFDFYAAGFSFLDLLNPYNLTYWGMRYNVPALNKLPKGFIPWCRKNVRFIDNKSLADFKFDKLHQRFSHIHPNLIKLFVKHAIPEDRWNTVARCMMIDHKNLVNIFDYEYMTMVRRMAETPDFTFDTNRGIEYNHELYEVMREKEHEKAINEFQSKFTPISELQTENLCVVLPLTVVDLVNEGRQQNNCVGHYYNKDIAQDEQVIYFIRHKSDPENSYHTCRFSVPYGTTVEDRIKNNRTEHNPEELQLVNMVNEVIRSVLSL